MKTLNERIKKLRKEKDLTQLQLAEMLNVTDKAVSKWETGEANPDITLLPKLSEVFGVSLDYLLMGKEEEEKVSLADMIPEKRIHYLIRKDDVDNFEKYGHATPFKYSRDSRGRTYGTNKIKESIYDGSSIKLKVLRGSDARNWIEINTINASMWQEIIESNANNIFNLCCDSYLRDLKDNICIAPVMTEIMDIVIKKCVDLERVDFLKALGVKHFAIEPYKIGGQVVERAEYLLPFVFLRNYENRKPFTMKPETLEYFFQKAHKSPKSFQYITELEIKTNVPVKLGSSYTYKRISGEVSQTSDIEYREYYSETYLYNDILLNAIKYGHTDLVKLYFEALQEEIRHREIQEEYDYNNTFVVVYSYSELRGRFISISKEVIDALIQIPNTDLAKQMVEYNRTIMQKFKKAGKTISSFIMSDAEIDRVAALNNTDLTEREKFKLEAVKNRIVQPQVLKQSRDLKTIREILDNNYYHYYEFVHDSLVKNDVRDLFKFCIDNDLTNLADDLLKGVEAEQILKKSWQFFSSTPKGSNKTGLEVQPQNSSYSLYSSYNNYGKREETTREKFIKKCKSDYNHLSRSSDNAVFDEMVERLADNPIIDFIKGLKEQIYIDVQNAIEKEKKDKKDAIERERVAKGLTKEYFEGLLARGDEVSIELFIIKLCALQDAIFLYDYKYEGADYSERLNYHFGTLRQNAPQSRQCDDGWGYWVLDTRWEEEEVKPAESRISHLEDLFYRLRVTRNNISHAKKENITKLSKDELVECLEYVFSINRKKES